MSDAMSSLAARLQSNGSYTAALDLWDDILVADSGNVSALCGKASAFAGLLRLEESDSLYRQALLLAPDCVDAVYGLASIRVRQSDYQGAIGFLEQFLEGNPGSPEILIALTLLRRQSGDSSGAADALQQLVDLRLDRADVHCDLGYLLQEEGRLEEAIQSCQRALELQEDYPEAMNNMGVALERLGRLDDAFQWYSRALALRPGFADAMTNVGAMHHVRGETDTAASLYWGAIAIAPSGFFAFYNLGLNCIARGEIVLALAAYSRALALDPARLDARWSRCLCSLLLGRYPSAWGDYEVRLLRKDGAKLYASSGLPRWGDQSLLPSDRLLVISEQGLGDTIQFMRYLPVLRERGVELEICAPLALHGLIRAAGIHPNPLAPAQVDSVREGYWIPLLSLPGQLGISPENPGSDSAYLHPDPASVEAWAERLAGEGRPLVALNWQGNPETEINNLIGRSLPLEALAPLAEVSGVSFVSMQKGHGSDQLPRCSFLDRFVRCQALVDEVWDFQETLAILANCDLLITSDTAIAHLGGAMGLPTWLLLQQVPDWRWGLEGESTFWYPSMRLFRQQQRGNWHEVIERVSEALDQVPEWDRRPHEALRSQPARRSRGPKAWLNRFWNWVETSGEIKPDSLSAESALDFAGSRLEQATVCFQDGLLLEARSACIDSICYQPERVEPYLLLGAIERKCQCLARAVEAFRGALCLDPCHLEAHQALIVCLFALVEEEQAWAEIERGLQFVPGSTLLVHPLGERWYSRGLPDVSKVLVVCNGSFADTIQWLCCLPPLIAVAGSVNLCAPAALHGLIEAAGLSLSLCTPEEAAASYDPWIPLLGLPGRLLTRVDHPQAQPPYLQVSAEQCRRWRDRLPCGEPMVAIEHALSLHCGDDLLQAQGVHWLRLPELDPDSGLPCESPIEGITDWLDLASLLANCELLITVDSPLAHLSGAMGRPTWLLLTSSPDWRWGLEGDTSAWYTSMRIFRQQPDQPWEALIGEVVQAVEIFRQTLAA